MQGIVGRDLCVGCSSLHPKQLEQSLAYGRSAINIQRMQAGVRERMNNKCSFQVPERPKPHRSCLTLRDLRRQQ